MSSVHFFLLMAGVTISPHLDYLTAKKASIFCIFAALLFYFLEKK